MTPEQFQRVERVFDAACRLHAAARDGFVAEQAHDDAQVLAEVRALLAEDARGAGSADALSRRAQGKLDEAEQQYKKAAERFRRVLGDEHVDTLTTLEHLGNLLREQGKRDEAEPHLRLAHTKARQALGGEHPTTLGITITLGALCVAQGKPDEAIALLAIEATARVEFTGGKSRRLALLLQTLGKARAGVGLGAGGDAGAFAAAEANLLEAHAIFVQAGGEVHKATRTCAQALVEFYASRHAVEPGKGYDGKSAEWQAKLQAAKRRY